MKDFIKMVFDVIRIKNAYRSAARKAWWYSRLSKSKWGKLYLYNKMMRESQK